MNTPRGSIDSPDWPNSYKGAKSCTWKITVGQRDAVTLSFDSFNLQEDGNCDKSKLIVKDGEHGDELGEFCGLNSPKVMRSNGNEMWLPVHEYRAGRRKGIPFVISHRFVF